MFHCMLYVWSLFIHPHVQYDSKERSWTCCTFWWVCVLVYLVHSYKFKFHAMPSFSVLKQQFQYNIQRAWWAWVCKCGHRQQFLWHSQFTLGVLLEICRRYASHTASQLLFLVHLSTLLSGPCLNYIYSCFSLWIWKWVDGLLVYRL